ncbi:MAG: alpha-1,2-fucosyltransferase [Bacteroidaceae bacterium]|nr:alpha-1,2-fucosyltransferase [Bacteroidaceae bacterium]
MIFVRDKGRMCNNILQYAHVYAWGREHGRSTMSMRFAYKYQYFRICHTAWHNFFAYIMAKTLAKLHLLPVITFEPDDCNAAELEQQMLRHRNAIVEGWHVRFYDLFLKYKQDILRLFAFDDGIEAAVRRTMTAACPQPTVTLGLHIRRGDYARFYGGRYFYSDEQYASLVEQFAALFPGKLLTVFVCGNDPNLDRDYYQKRLPGVRFCFPDGNPAEDLCLLSQCDWLIGAPSTFTLVAAMYHDRPLYWVEDAKTPVTLDLFGHFDHLFRHIR